MSKPKEELALVRPSSESLLADAHCPQLHPVCGKCGHYLEVILVHETSEYAK